MSTTTAALRELADVIDLIDQLGAQLEAAWIRHGELCAAVDASSTLVSYRRRNALDREIITAGAQLADVGGLDKALDKALDKVSAPTEIHEPAAVSAPAAPAICTSSTAKVHQLRTVRPKTIGTHAQAIMRWVAERDEVTPAQIIEAMVIERNSTRQAIYQVIKSLVHSGKLKRAERGLYYVSGAQRALAKA